MSLKTIIIAFVLASLFVVVLWPALHVNNDAYNQNIQAVVSDNSQQEAKVKAMPEPTPVEPVVEEPKEKPTVVESTVELIADKVEPKAVPAVKTESEAPSNSGALYSVVDGNKLDADSYAGFKLFRNWCARCHGTYGQGMAGPSLPESLKIISKEQFFKTVEEGKTGTIGSMPAWKTNPKVMAGLDKIYAYLMARSDGAIGEVKPKKQ
ncbi:MAG: cytochrome c [Gammaproteobacteria bacterium]|nr:cytochrome c [Gammaproteobacteria bacterium]